MTDSISWNGNTGDQSFIRLCEQNRDTCLVVVSNVEKLPHEEDEILPFALTLLAVDELKRLKSFKSAQASWEFAVSHAILRCLLSEQVQIPAGQIKLAGAGRHGVAPILDHDEHNLCFSISHSAPHFAFAFRANRAVGIDIEPRSRACEAIAVKKHFLNDDELHSVSEMTAMEREYAALSAWVLKEAVLKAARSGFATDPKRLTVSFERESLFQTVSLPIEAGNRPFWGLTNLVTPCNGAAVAVAAELPEPAVELFTLNAKNFLRRHLLSLRS